MNAFPVPNGASNSPLAAPQLTRPSDHPHHPINQNGGSMAPPPPSSTSSSPTSPQSSLASPTGPPSSAASVLSAASSVVNGGVSLLSGNGGTPTPGRQKKKHVCSICERAFTTSGHLARHTRAHTGERNHRCPFPGCEARCSRMDNLQQHYRIHLYPGPRRSYSASTRATIHRAMGGSTPGVSYANDNAALAAAQAAQMGVSVALHAPPLLAHAHAHPPPPPHTHSPLTHAHMYSAPPPPDAPPPLGGPGSVNVQQGAGAMRSSVERSPDLARYLHSPTTTGASNGAVFQSLPSAGNSPVQQAQQQQHPSQHATQQQYSQQQQQFTTFAPQSQVPQLTSMYPTQGAHPQQQQQAYGSYSMGGGPGPQQQQGPGVQGGGATGEDAAPLDRELVGLFALA